MVRWVLALVLAVLVVGAPSVHGAPLETAHFRFHMTRGTEGNTRKLAARAEERFRALCTMVGACDSLASPIDVWLAEDAESFAAAFPDGSPMAEWAVGVAFIRKNRIVLRAHGSALFTLRETFDHEVSHLLVHAVTGGHPIPRWFSEGVAIWQAGEPVLKRLMDAQRAALTDRLVPLSDLNRHFPASGPAVALAYAEGALFVRWLERDHGVATIPSILRRMADGQDFHRALESTVGQPLEQLEAAWMGEMERSSTVVNLLGDANLMWIVISLLFLWASAVKVRRRRRALEAMGVIEEEERAARLGGPADPPPVLH